MVWGEGLKDWTPLGLLLSPLNAKTDHASENIIALTCKACGGRLDYLSGDELATCLFCGSSHLVRQPTSTVERLRDLENNSLSISYFHSMLDLNEAPDCILAAIKRDPSGFTNPESLEMEREGVFFPAWIINVSVQCSWHGEYSEVRSVTKYRKVTKQGSGGTTYVENEPYTAQETIWHPHSGSHVFSTMLHTPAVSGFRSTSSTRA